MSDTNELQVIKTDFEGVRQKVVDLQVVDEKSQNYANESIAIIKRMIREAEESRKAKTQPLVDQKNAIDARYKEFSVPATDLLNSLTQKSIAYTRKCEEERAKAQQEQQRLLEEARRKEEAAAKKAEKKGLPPPPPVPVPVVEVPQVRKMSATSFGTMSVQDNWTAEVVDVLALCKAVAIGAAPVQAVEPNTVFLNKQAKVFKGQSPYPGVNFINKGKMSLR